MNATRPDPLHPSRTLAPDARSRECSPPPLPPITGDDAVLTEASTPGCLPTLLVSMLHLTRNATLLDGPIRPRQTTTTADGGAS